MGGQRRAVPRSAFRDRSDIPIYQRIPHGRTRGTSAVSGAVRRLCSPLTHH